MIGAGVVLMAVGFATLLAMVLRVYAPGLGLALAAFAALFGGMLLTLLSASARVRGPHDIGD